MSLVESTKPTNEAKDNHVILLQKHQQFMNEVLTRHMAKYERSSQIR